ncbi:MAG: hypothetical protein CVU43_17665 [Chloroflexi bacterium HGW-Chloroflexi-5]|jgi:hypothetical protein|nr:MAG: hypothetical protein CVU43_17665 [Chloroflexi bacterium HGW-Chloroflexi-5]PKP04496.1 MAG: hypothetical protein CVU11_04750 [Bacteroidetes bacterium HGW-Bacteroidetes-6]
MQQFEFTAWSLYTGPSNLQSIYENSSWVVGRWDGINGNTSAAEIKKDIDARIDILINAFQRALPNYKTYNRFFIVPEFFFRCQQGPYPYVKVDGVDYPVEYIQKTLKGRLSAIIPNDNNYYSFFSGSVLTSNVSDYDQFLSSVAVTERLQQLNNCLADDTDLMRKMSSNQHTTASWHRELFNRTKKTPQNKSVNSSDALNDFMKVVRANPLCTVRNRGVYLFFNRSMMAEMQSFICEKQYESTVDLTMGVFNGNRIEHGGMITEWMANYPSISILGGDKQTDGLSTNARFTPEFLWNADIGLEICLDHRKQRLRRTVDMCIQNGADADNYPILHQIISSGGMQILDYAVAADRSSRIFNADGCDKIYKVYGDESTVILNGEAGKFTGITTGVYNKSVQSKWTGKDGQTYYSHSQLAFCTNESKVEGFNNALGLNNEKAETYTGTPDTPSNTLTDLYEAQIFSLNGTTDLFGATTGELHYYSDVSGD